MFVAPKPKGNVANDGLKSRIQVWIVCQGLACSVLSNSHSEGTKKLMMGKDNGLPASRIVQLIEMPGRFLRIKKGNIGRHAERIRIVEPGIHGENLPVLTPQAKIACLLLVLLKCRGGVELR